MTWLSPYLSKRVEVRRSVQVPNSAGGFDRSYEILLTVWMHMHPKSKSIGYVRGEQIDESQTHEFLARKMAVASLGREFARSYSSAFDMMADLSPLKSEYFLWTKSTTTKGRLFRVHRVVDSNECGEFLVISAEEIEEQGTGYAE